MALRPIENTVQPSGPVTERFRPADFASGAENIARGAQGLAQGISRAAEDLDQIGEVYDTAAVKQADAEDLKQIAGIRAKVMSSKGFDTQVAIGEARTQIEEIKKQRLSSLHNPRQKRMYTDVFNQRSIALEESFATHSATQIAAANQGAAVARAEASSDAAVDAYGTGEFDGHLATARNEAAAANAGMGPDVIGRKQAEVTSSIYSRAISNMISDPDHADLAKIALDNHAKDILPADEEKLRKALNPILEENQVDADVGRAFTGGGPAPDANEAPSPNNSTPRTGTTQKPVMPADPLRGKGTITNTAAQHRARGSGNALDIGAPEGTAIHPPMSGKVVKSWYDQRGGWSILVEHPNGYVTGYAHMRSKSALHEGQEVDADTILGSVGQTGHATGPHLHYTVRQSRGGPKVDPSAALWDNRGTVKPDTPSWKEATPIKYEADENALGRALTNLHEIATRENWSPRRYDKAVARAREVAGVQNQLATQQQEDNYDAAVASIVDLGDNFTSVSQVKGYGNLKPRQQMTLRNIADSNKKSLAGEGGVKANGEVFTALYLSALDPAHRQEFMNTDLAGAPMTPGERRQLYAMKIKLKNEPTGDWAASLGKADYFAKRYLPDKAFKGQQRQQFTDRFVSAVERQQTELKRPLTDKEMDDIARAQTVQVAGSGGTHYAFEGQPGTVDIPKVYETIRPDVRTEIGQRLLRRGIGATPRNIVAEFLASRSR